MAAPFGHGFVGVVVARRLGVRSRRGLAAAAFAASLPDIDIPLSFVLHGDGWKAHRTWTHTAAFTLATGALVGLAGAFHTESADGERDLVVDAIAGAAIVSSHLVLDKIPYLPEIPVGPKVLELHVVNWLLDAAQWATVAWLLWPKAPAPDDQPAL